MTSSRTGEGRVLTEHYGPSLLGRVLRLVPWLGGVVAAGSLAFFITGLLQGSLAQVLVSTVAGTLSGLLTAMGLFGMFDSGD